MSSGVEPFVLDNVNDNNHQQHAPYHDQQVTRKEASTVADMDSYSQSSSSLATGKIMGWTCTFHLKSDNIPLQRTN